MLLSAKRWAWPDLALLLAPWLLLELPAEAAPGIVEGEPEGRNERPSSHGSSPAKSTGSSPSRRAEPTQPVQRSSTGEFFYFTRTSTLKRGETGIAADAVDKGEKVED